MHSLFDDQDMTGLAGSIRDGEVSAREVVEFALQRLEERNPAVNAVIADRAYATGVIRTELRRRGIKAVIPDKRDQAAARKRRGSNGGRPPGLDADAYKGRNVVERFFALAKQWRGIATRYDKTIASYASFVAVAAFMLWMR